MFARMLDHPLIDIELGVAFEDVRSRISYDQLVFTRPIDEYFDHRSRDQPSHLDSALSQLVECSQRTTALQRGNFSRKGHPS